MTVKEAGVNSVAGALDGDTLPVVQKSETVTEPAKVIALVDRKEGGRERLEALG